MNRDEFLRGALEAARTARANGAPINPSVAAAQAALESGWGRSQLARKYNNLKGVKAGSSWAGKTVELPTREVLNGQWVTTTAIWRVYDSWEHAFADYGELIRRVYPHAAEVADDAKAFLEALTSGRLKYATDPNYTQKIWRIIRDYGLPTSEREIYQTLVVHYNDREWVFRHPFVMTVRGGKVDLRFTEGETHA